MTGGQDWASEQIDTSGGPFRDLRERLADEQRAEQEVIRRMGAERKRLAETLRKLADQIEMGS